jgi:hypothetical protein
VLLSQSSQTLLVEEGYPGLLREELLGKGEGQGRSAPADLHDGKQTGTNGSADLVESAGACDDSHG